MWWIALAGILTGVCSCDLAFGLSSRDKVDGGTTDAPRVDCSNAALRLCTLFEDDLTEGQATDSSTQQNHARVVNVESLTRGTQLAVHVTDQSQITIAEDSSLDIPDTVTFEMWFFVDNTPLAGTGAILLDNDGQYAMYVDDRNALWCVAVRANEIQVKQTITIRAWHHVACVHEQGVPTTLTMYLDGNAVDSTTGVGPLATGSTTGINIGQNNGVGDLNALVGGVDNVRIWAKPLSPAEIRSIVDND